MRTVCVWLLMTGLAFAEDVVRFDPATGAYQGCLSIGDTTVFLTDPNDLKTAKPSYLVVDPLTCLTASFAGIPERYRKVANGQVVEMTQAEQDAVDAPPPLTPDEQALATLNAQLDADDVAWTSLTTAQKLAVVKTLLRRAVLQRRLGRE